MNFDKTAKIFSRVLTGLVAVRSLFRSGTGINKILNAPDELDTKKTSKETPKKDDKKQKQLHGALLGMGYARPEADRAVKELSEKFETTSLPDLVREALGILNA